MTVALPCRRPERAARAVGQREIAVLHLHLGMRLAAQLAHGFQHLGEPAAIARMVAAQATAVGVERQLAGARDQIAVGHQLAALALLGEAQVFELYQHGDGEAVVDRHVLHVGWLHARLGEGRRTAEARARVGQVDLAAHLGLHELAGADQLDLGPLELGRDLGRHHDDGAAAVGDDAAIQAMQRVGDHRRVHDFLDRDHVAQQSMLVVLRVMRGRDLDPGKLLGGRAELVHVAHGAHGVHVHHRRPVGELEGLVRRRRAAAAARHGAGRHAVGARPAGQGDQRHLALARRDRLGGVGDMQQIGRAAGVGRIDVARLQPHVLDHRHRPEARRIAGAEIAVDVVLGEAGIVQRALGHLGVDLRQRDVRREPRRMLVDAGNVGFALDAHRRANSPSMLHCIVGD